MPAQLDDPVQVRVTLPASTEEWAEQVITDLNAGYEVERREGALVVTKKIGGNCNALTNAIGVLRDLEEAFQEGNIDIMSLRIRAKAITED